MAKPTRQYVFEAMELLPDALTPFVEKRLESTLKGHWHVNVAEEFNLRPHRTGQIDWDQAALLKAMDRFWEKAFKPVLGRAERSIVNELIEVRNRLAHNETFTYDDAERALDSMRRLMEAIGAGNTADRISTDRQTILRTKYAELTRTAERRRTAPPGQPADAPGGLRPWRTLVQPHPDVASGTFEQAEFAADLGKVHRGSGPPEYANPRDFFARTYLTEGLSTLLTGAVKRLNATGGDPIVELQTNFGGGKTHSMLALYHLAGGTLADDLPGLDQLLARDGLTLPARISRAVLVGTARGPQDILPLDGSRTARTTWGDMAWQLGGAAAFDRLAENDARGIAPGSNLLEDLFKRHAPALILIDEWVAYLRQIYRVDGLPSGSFDANLSFVQSLTEAVKSAPGVLLVASLPASQIEVGGTGGQEALARLKQTFSRVESSWCPASQEESYEIVRRRLFRDIPGDKFPDRDNTLKQFARLYRDTPDAFPNGCADESYRRKLEKAWPIHPEIFDQLYTTWGALEKFQRTRGVLRLMAHVIHRLWMEGDNSAMIMPGGVPVGHPRVQSELMRYLEDTWQSIVAGDVDGEDDGSIPFRIDRDNPNLGRHSATRRVARTLFLATAPTHGQQNRGLSDRQINLGTLQPGERPSLFGDALRRLANRARFLHSDQGRYWYSMAPSLNRLAADCADQYEEAAVLHKIDKGLTININGLVDRGPFSAVHVAPAGSANIPDEPCGIRAVVLGVGHPHNSRDDSAARAEAENILLQRGNTPRIYRNTLVFIAADARRMDSLKQAWRNALGWGDIVRDTERLDLTQSDSALARKKHQEATEILKTRLHEAWCWLIRPYQNTPRDTLEWNATKLTSRDGILSRAGTKLLDDQDLLTDLGLDSLNNHLTNHIWQDRPHLPLRDLWSHLNSHLYMPRVKNSAVLIKAVQRAASAPQPGPFAYADRWDETAGTYEGLSISAAGGGAAARVVIDDTSVIVRPDVAALHQQRQTAATTAHAAAAPAGFATAASAPPPAPEEPPATRFQGTVRLSADRPVRDLGGITESIITHLTRLPRAQVTLTLDIDAEIPSGIDRATVRTLLENAAALRFEDKKLE
ncbi:MAG: ATP-binding protein [Rhodobacteraceae bacterium]|nr:ATP-binding protein [Paracoccaceae bacterium]